MAAINLGVDRQTDACHDPHVHDDVRRVGELDAELGHRRTDRPHAEGEDIHRAARHAAGEHPSQLAAHLKWVLPIIVWTGRLLGLGANEGTILDARHVGGVRACVIAAWPKFFV